MVKTTFENIKTNSGFTLIETLVAIAILLIGIIGPLYIFSTNLGAIRRASDETTAYYLAQDGLEMGIAKLKQNLVLSKGGGILIGDDINECAFNASDHKEGCVIWTESGSISNGCVSSDAQGPCTPIYQPTGGGDWSIFSEQFCTVNVAASGIDDCTVYQDTSPRYIQGNSSLTTTKFRRVISFEKVDLDATRQVAEGARIRVNVYWSEKGKEVKIPEITTFFYRSYVY